MKKTLFMVQDFYNCNSFFEKGNNTDYIKHIAKISLATKPSMISNIEMVVYRLNTITALLKEFLLQNKKVLFIGTTNIVLSFMARSLGEISGQHYIDRKWIAGTLTNRDKIFNFSKNNLKLNRYLKIKEYFKGLENMKQDPDLICLFGAANNSHIVNEAFKLHIPIVGIIEDTNVSFETRNKITYPLISSNLEQTYIYYQYLNKILTETLREKTKNKLKFLYYVIQYYKSIKKVLPRKLSNIIILNKDMVSFENKITGLAFGKKLSIDNSYFTKNFLIKKYVSTSNKNNTNKTITNKNIDLLDAWGHKIVYKKVSRNSSSFVLYSYGNHKGSNGQKSDRIVYIIK